MIDISRKSGAAHAVATVTARTGRPAIISLFVRWMRGRRDFGILRPAGAAAAKALTSAPGTPSRTSELFQASSSIIC